MHSSTLIRSQLNHLCILPISSSLIFRKCDNCGRKFATSYGLEIHLNRIKNKDCGRKDRKTKKILANFKLSEKRREINSQKLDDLGDLNDITLHKTKCKCVLRTEDKEHVLNIFDIHKKHLKRPEVWFPTIFD